jgi:WD40 repeat protein
VAASHRDGIVRMWDVCTGQLTRRMKAHLDWANCVAFMPDGKGLVSGGRIAH